MPETLRTREYYMEKAKTIPLLREVIKGETTFRSHLEAIVAQAEIGGGFREDEEDAFGTITWDRIAKEYGRLTRALAACGEQGYDSDACEAYLSAIQDSFALPVSAGIFGVAATVMIYVGLLPPFTPVALVLGAGAGGLSGLLGYGSIKEKNIRKRGNEILAPIYAAADRADSSIMRCFSSRLPLESSRPLSEEDERAYRAMSALGRRAVADGLRRQLEAGALNMGEAELDRYLGSLTMKEATPDA